MALHMGPDVVEIAIEPKTKADQEKLELALTLLATDNPTFRVTIDHEFGQTIVRGTSELHLQELIERLNDEFEVDAYIGAPQVAYREYLAKPVEVDFTHKKQTGGSGQFGRVRIAIAPGEPDSGIRFFNEVESGNIPSKYVQSIEKGMREIAESGLLMGFPVVDFEVHLIDGAYHDTDSSPLAFELTGRGAMREAAERAGIKLLEPIMKVEVVTPVDYLGDIIRVINSRRGQIQHTDMRGDAQVVVATAPMAKLFGLEKELSALTRGGAVVEMVFERYAPIEPNGIDPDDTFPAAAALRA